jgi:CsoR family transcriptional regulator, copper-sensing transcriptional repressor
MFQPKDTQTRITHRLKIARGHLNKVITMTDEQAYCIDILHQLQAIEKALKETGNVILENHLNTCAADAIKEGKKDEAIKEIMEVFRRKH